VASERVLRTISFSGIDGAGKSTQIQALQSSLIQLGLKISTLTMWDDVVVGARFRETASHLAFRGDQGIGAPENPLVRRDKNINSWLLTIVRCCLYLADAASLFLRIRKLERAADHDAVIFDRYIYDELANLPLNRAPARAFVRFLLGVIPTPDVAFLIDALPEEARSRKPEYPLEFLHRNRQSYLALSRIATNIIVIHNGSIEEMEQAVRAKLQSDLSQTAPGSLKVSTQR
jgi:thymidylate kinase